MKSWDRQRTQSARVHAARLKDEVVYGAAGKPEPRVGRQYRVTAPPRPVTHAAVAVRRERRHVGFHGWVPPGRLVKWPFGNFATVIMIVFPIFWPILALFLLIEVLALAFWVALFLLTNTVALVAWLIAAVAVAVFDR